MSPEMNNGPENSRSPVEKLREKVSELEGTLQRAIERVESVREKYVSLSTAIASSRQSDNIVLNAETLRDIFTEGASDLLEGEISSILKVRDRGHENGAAESMRHTLKIEDEFVGSLRKLLNSARGVLKQMEEGDKK